MLVRKMALERLLESLVKDMSDVVGLQIDLAGLLTMRNSYCHQEKKTKPMKAFLRLVKAT